MRQSSKSIVKMNNAADRAAIRQALAILEDNGVNIIDDDEDYDDIAIPYSNIQISDERRREERRKERLKLKQIQHQQKHVHALLSPSRSKATRRASVTAFHANANAKLLHEDSSSCNNSEATATTADIDSSCCTSSQDDGSSSGSYSCSSTSCASSLKSEKHREADSNTKRKSRTTRSKQRHSQAHQSKKEEEEEHNSSSSSCTVNNKSSRSIRFAKYDQIEYIPHLNDLSPTEIKATWMQEDDYNRIRERSLRLVEMIEDPQKRYPISNDTMIVNTHLICVRGLCDMTTHCVEARDAVQQQLQTAVFRLQESQQQQDNKMGDGQGADHTQATQALRQVSRKYSKKSTKAARFVGISDRVTISIK
mmetsp:Transcript_11046/g.10714  ORF Transcript_11046/g.10714 Transcript_11046/m.10714 type:complete len:365 (-) Transcript_11046:57-1151(-)